MGKHRDTQSQTSLAPAYQLSLAHSLPNMLLDSRSPVQRFVYGIHLWNFLPTTFASDVRFWWHFYAQNTQYSQTMFPTFADVEFTHEVAKSTH